MRAGPAPRRPLAPLPSNHNGDLQRPDQSLWWLHGVLTHGCDMLSHMPLVFAVRQDGPLTDLGHITSCLCTFTSPSSSHKKHIKVIWTELFDLATSSCYFCLSSKQVPLLPLNLFCSSHSTNQHPPFAHPLSLPFSVSLRTDTLRAWTWTRLCIPSLAQRLENPALVQHLLDKQICVPVS